MTIAIIGGRDFNDPDLMERSLSDIVDQVVLVVSGEASGADHHGKEWAFRHGKEYIGFKADWDKHGKAAGPIRNEFVIKAVTHVAAFWDEQSKGTAHAISLARKHRKRLRIVKY